MKITIAEKIAKRATEENFNMRFNEDDGYYPDFLKMKLPKEEEGNDESEGCAFCGEEHTGECGYATNDSYEDYFEDKMEQKGINSPAELAPPQKSRFFEDVDQGWESKEEKGELEYSDYFQDKMDQHGVESPSHLDQENKSRFFEDVDRGWESKEEKGEGYFDEEAYYEELGQQMSEKEDEEEQAYYFDMEDDKPAEEEHPEENDEDEGEMIEIESEEEDEDEGYYDEEKGYFYPDGIGYKFIPKKVDEDEDDDDEEEDGFWDDDDEYDSDKKAGKSKSKTTLTKEQKALKKQRAKLKKAMDRIKGLVEEGSSLNLQDKNKIEQIQEMIKGYQEQNWAVPKDADYWLNLKPGKEEKVKPVKKVKKEIPKKKLESIIKIKNRLIKKIDDQKKFTKEDKEDYQRVQKHFKDKIKRKRIFSEAEVDKLMNTKEKNKYLWEGGSGDEQIPKHPDKVKNPSPETKSRPNKKTPGHRHTYDEKPKDKKEKDHDKSIDTRRRSLPKGGKPKTNQVGQHCKYDEDHPKRECPYQKQYDKEKAESNARASEWNKTHRERYNKNHRHYNAEHGGGHANRENAEDFRNKENRGGDESGKWTGGYNDAMADYMRDYRKKIEEGKHKPTPQQFPGVKTREVDQIKEKKKQKAASMEEISKKIMGKILYG